MPDTMPKKGRKVRVYIRPRDQERLEALGNASLAEIFRLGLDAAEGEVPSRPVSRGDSIKYYEFEPCFEFEPNLDRGERVVQIRTNARGEAVGMWVLKVARN